MNFTTKISIPKFNQPIDYSSKILTLGSCFAENMGAKFDYYKFQNKTNPFGIIFNPISIENIINRAVNKIEFTENDVFFHNNIWNCFEVHSFLGQNDKERFLQNLNNILQSTRNQITESTHIIVTYGTSWIYRNKSSSQVVANCHKVHQNQFDKEILSVEVIKKSIENTINLIQKVNPDCKFIFTISPVRHIKDGFIENQRSKAHLITALHYSNFQLPTHIYFPSYEIMMDELRDYRFYTKDMLHPNQLAIDYIWERFVDCIIDINCFSTIQEVETIQKGLAHRPFNSYSESHQQFLVSLNKKIMHLQKQLPYIKF
jgi:hypothetical protein